MSANEELVRQQLEINQAKQEAARRETAGILRWARITRYAILPGMIVPILGFAWIGFMTFVAFWVAAFVAIKGNTKDGLLAMAFTILTGLGSVLVWTVVNLIVIGLFG